MEWTTLGVAAGVLLICVGSGALPGLEVRWSKALQWVLYPVAWLGVTRWLGREDSGDGGWVVGSAAAVLAGVFAVGSSEAALAYHEVRSGRARLRLPSDVATRVDVVGRMMHVRARARGAK